MKKLLIILLLFASCQKDEICEQKTKDLTVELYGAFSFSLDYVSGSIENNDLVFNNYDYDSLQYQININVNGLDHVVNIDTIVHSNWVGPLYKRKLHLKKDDKVSVKVIKKPDHSYVYLAVYSHLHHINRFEFKDMVFVEIPPYNQVLHIE